MWKMKVEVIPVVVGALGTMTNSIQLWLNKIEVEMRVERMQKTALLETARILRKVLDD